MILMNLSKKMIACVAVMLALFAFAPATYDQRGDTAARRQRPEAMMQ